MDMSAFRDIYEKKDNVIAAREEEIARLKNELESIRRNQIPYDKVSKEIFRLWPDISRIALTSGNSYMRDSSSSTGLISVNIKTSKILDESELKEIKEWLKIRLDTEDLILNAVPADTLAR